MKKIFITGGHLTPAEAVIDQMQKEGSWQIFFLGRKFQQEGRPYLATEFQLMRADPRVKFLTLTTGRLQRHFTRYTFLSLLKIPFGFCQSIYYVVLYRPNVILSFGGYLALPVTFCAWVFGIPVVTHEQTTIPGLANRLIAIFSRKVLLSWPEEKTPPSTKTVYTGNPLREAITRINFTPDYKKFQLSARKYPGQKVIYITGGNQGSKFLNDLLENCLPELLKDHLVIHSTGAGEYQKFVDRRRNLKARDKYFPYEFVDSENIGWVLKFTDIVVSRAGANTVLELAALGKVGILCPLPWSGGGEQAENAKRLEKFGGVVTIAQSKLTKQLFLSTVKEISTDFSRYLIGARQARSLIVPDAAKRILAEINAIVAK